MKVKKYRPNPRLEAMKVAQQFIEEAQNSISETVREDARSRVFAIELLAVRCGWTKLEKELEAWRENR